MSKNVTVFQSANVSAATLTIAMSGGVYILL